MNRATRASSSTSNKRIGDYDTPIIIESKQPETFLCWSHYPYLK
jgi:hypothetical protein